MSLLEKSKINEPIYNNFEYGTIKYCEEEKIVPQVRSVYLEAVPSNPIYSQVNNTYAPVEYVSNNEILKHGLDPNIPDNDKILYNVYPNSVKDIFPNENQ